VHSPVPGRTPSPGLLRACTCRLAINYREAHGMFCSNGVLFNHESPTTGTDIRHQKNYARGGAYSGRQALKALAADRHSFAKETSPQSRALSDTPLCIPPRTPSIFDIFTT
jgi:hypothetical protein